MVWKTSLSLNMLRSTGLLMPGSKTYREKWKMGENDISAKADHILRSLSGQMTLIFGHGSETNELKGRCHPAEPPYIMPLFGAYIL
jgi:hypothetical protein